MFDPALEFHPGKGMITAEILRLHPNQQGAVGVLPVPGKAAHAVGHHMLRLGGGSYHLSTGTHAESVHTAALWQVGHQLVIRRPQSGMVGELSVQCLVHPALQMLEPHAHCKAFLRHGDPRAPEHGKGVPGTVTDGENGMLRRQEHGFPSLDIPDCP